MARQTLLMRASLAHATSRVERASAHLMNGIDGDVPAKCKARDPATLQPKGLFGLVLESAHVNRYASSWWGYVPQMGGNLYGRADVWDGQIYLCPDEPGWIQAGAVVSGTNNRDTIQYCYEDEPDPVQRCLKNNPVDVATGVKWETEVDYDDGAGLRLERTYNSGTMAWTSASFAY